MGKKRFGEFDFIDLRPHAMSIRDKYIKLMKKFKPTLSSSEDRVYLSDNVVLSPERIGGNVSRNVVAIGQDRCGKTHFFVEPNIENAKGSLVVLDNGGHLFRKYRSRLKLRDYQVYCLNLTDCKDSDFYNPLSYLNDEKDIEELADMLLIGDDTRNSFEASAKRSLLIAILGYLMQHRREEDQDFTAILKLLHSSNLMEDPDDETALDVIYDEIYEYDPKDYCATAYKAYRKIDRESAARALDSLTEQMQFYEIGHEESFLRTERKDDRRNICLNILWERKTAIFIVTDILQPLYNNLLTIFFKQLYTALCHTKTQIADDSKQIYSVDVILDDFDILPRIPNLGTILNQSASYGVGTFIIVREPGAIKRIYREETEGILKSMSTTLCMGSMSQDEIERFLKTSDGNAFKRKRPGLHIIENLALDECVVLLKGHPPIIDKKFGSK